MYAVSGSALCPVQAYANMVSLCPGRYLDPAFFVKMCGKIQPISYGLLQSTIKKDVPKLGLDPRMFSSHSLRRAGASWAFRAGVPGELIQAHGDWVSQAYLRYLELPFDERMQVACKMSESVVRLLH